MDYYNYLKSLHLIFVITWFAGLFYIVRLFVYQIEANDKPSPEKEILQKQYKIMTYRLWYIITWPSAVLASFFCVLDVTFYLDWKCLVANALDARKTWLCFCAVFIPLQMPQNIPRIAKRPSKIHHKLYAFVERRSNNYPICRSVFSYSEKCRKLDLWCGRNYVVFYLDYVGLSIL